MIDVRWIEDQHFPNYLGRYSNEPGPGAIDRKKLGDWKSGEFPYWIPDNHHEFDPKNWDHVSGKDKAEVIKEYGSLKNAEAAYRMADYKRAEALNRGEFCLEGCVVTARINVFSEEDSLWGIESDSDDQYRSEIERDVTRRAISLLRDTLLKLDILPTPKGGGFRAEESMKLTVPKCPECRRDANGILEQVHVWASLVRVKPAIFEYAGDSDIIERDSQVTVNNPKFGVTLKCDLHHEWNSKLIEDGHDGKQKES